MIAKYKFDKFDTDYFQFHLKDSETKETLKDAVSENLAVSKYIVGIGTQRNTDAKIIIEVYDEEPLLDTNIKWRQILESELNLTSGSLVLTSPTLEESEQKRISFIPDIYRLRIYFGDGNERGSHTYKINFWCKS